MKQNDSIKNVLIYCRESRDDGFINYERIETQRDILVSYCKNKNLGNITAIIMDDNKSGTDFERLDPIKERIRNHEVDILLLKDASRLGRNILESLTFTAFLDAHNVELVFESERYDEDMFPLIAWFNERRAKDDSIKIRRVLKHKMEEGEMVIKAPYGYIKKGNQLVVNEETAAVVREIFSLFLAGHGQGEIAAIINKRGYPTPSQLKSQYENTNRAHIWNRQHIERILKHVIYTGDMPYGMRRKASFKSKKYMRVSKEDWIVKPGHHEAIISKSIFEEAQAKIKSRGASRLRNTAKNIFSGLLFCGRCGGRLYRKTQNGKQAWYSCCKNVKEGSVKDHIKPNYGCYSHRIRESILIEIVRDYICLLTGAPELNQYVLAAMRDRAGDEAKAMKEIQAMKVKIENSQAKASLVYDDKLEGRLPEYLFHKKIEEISKEIDTLSDNLVKAEQSLKKLQESQKHSNQPLELACQIHDMEISHEIICLLFKKIIVFNPQEISPQVKEQYNISDEDYTDLSEFGGIVFLQNFIFTGSVYWEKNKAPFFS